MANSMFGYNVLKVDDKTAFLAHIRRLRPPALLFYNSENDFAKQVKAEFPDMIIIQRSWPDGELYKHIGPIEWLDQHESQAAGGLYLYTCNESGLSQENIDWHITLMKEAAKRGVHLVVLNPATGTWDTPDFPRLKPLLQLASVYKDLFIIGLHNYAGGVITSGLLGGNPDGAGVAPGKPGGRNLIPRANWPPRSEILGKTTFHLGRHSWLINYCNAIGLTGAKMPRFGLTETGFDFTSDIGTWLNTLDHGGFTSVNGWQTLRAQWMKWWPQFGWGENAFMEQWKYAADALLPGLEFALFFAYGDDGNWYPYDISRSGIPILLEDYAATTTPAQPPPVIAPPPPPPPADTSAARAEVEAQLVVLQNKYMADFKALMDRLIALK